jgi:formate dehydrogenase subunit gamma
VPFLFLLATGLALYVPELKAIHAGGFRLFALAHVCAGIATLAAPIALWIGLRVSAKFRSDLGATVRFEPTDTAWLEYAAGAVAGLRRREPPVGKFNAGQKLNTIFSLAVTAGLLATGAVLAVNYFARGAIPAAFVEQVFPWHTRLMILSLPVLAGHIYLALLHPSTRPSIHGIIGGRVNLAWATRHHRRWVDELEGENPSA